MKTRELETRQAIIDQCRRMNAIGLNQGTSGNISVRQDDRMLITPSAIPYEAMEPEMIAAMPLDGEDGAWDGPLKPSTEWRFHLDIMKGRPEVGAIVHAHAPFCTALAICRKDIPACHYMIATFGGTNVRCSGYATYGTAALSDTVLAALEGRTACLMANHGMIATGADLDEAMARAIELETLARQYYLTLAIGGPVLLSADEMAEAIASFGSYGLQADPGRAGKAARKTRKGSARRG